MALKARKRDIARSKKGDEKNKGNSIKDQDIHDLDVAQPSYGSKVIYTKYFLKFFIEGDSARSTDSIIIFHTSEHHDITEADKSRLQHFIKKIPAAKVWSVVIRQIETGELKEQQHVIISREKKIKKFLRQQVIGSHIVFQR